MPHQVKSQVAIFAVICAVASAVVTIGWLSLVSLEEPGSGSDGVLPDRKDVVLHLETEKEQYMRGELVVMRTWFSNQGANPVTIATYHDGCLLEVMIFDDLENLVYNGTQFNCPEYSVGDIVAEPGASTRFGGWEWDLHYRIVETGLDDAPVLTRTDETVPSGKYVIMGRALGTAYVAQDEIWVT